MEGYEKVNFIGSGSFGQVYCYRRKGTNQFVALKLISKKGRQEREIVSLRQECEIQKNLHHPNIIQMLDSFETNDDVVVVTELAQGDLCKLMKMIVERGRLFSSNEIQHYAFNLVSALYFLHSHRILHRDIKPQNILIGWDGQAKLCDFGFARTMGINTYMLTSIKGTPLYMAPEVIQGKPYDHNADLWSLGCILYELMVGRSPFFTVSLFHLMEKVKNEQIIWPEPEHITSECLSFLQGLLEKDPQKRLTWPALLSHPFVRDGLHIDKSVEEFSLTKALSPSQEFAKEKQRQNLQRKLDGYSKLLARTTKKLEDAQKKLKRCSEEGLNRVGMAAGNIGVPPQNPLKISGNLYPANKNENMNIMFENMNLNDRVKNYKAQGNQKRAAEKQDDKSGTSSCESTTSSSDTDSDDGDEDDTNTVIMEGTGSQGGSGLLWKSGALFTLHSFGSEDKPINSDEWIYFLMNTMKEVLDNPKSLCEKPMLSMLVSPLRNHLADPEVVEKIALLLSLPFTLDNSILELEPGLMSNLLTLYLDTKVLPNLLYSCKLIVRRRRVERGGSVSLEEIRSILTVEDLEGLEKCIRLITFLVHTEQDFVTQFCDSVCVLQAFAILQLFIKLDSVRSGLAGDTISILCHVLRTFPSNKSIVEQVLLDESDGDVVDSHSELWRLMSHSNPTLQSRSLRTFVYLCLNSQRVKTEFLDKQRPKVWGILRRAIISTDSSVRETAEFVQQALNYKSNSTATTKSYSSTSNSGCRSQATSALALSTSVQCDDTPDINDVTNESFNEQVEETATGLSASAVKEDRFSPEVIH